MARAKVYAGACGLSATINVSRVDNKHVRVVVQSACEQITAMNPDLACLQWQGKGNCVFTRITDSAVYQSAARHIRHPACPVPAAILKAIEIEVGIATPKDVSIELSANGNEPGCQE